MKTSDIQDIDFREAVEAIDAGNIYALQKLITAHPSLLSERLVTGGEGYFTNPYLLYFVADNPIRIDKLPTNIAAITKFLIDALKATNIISLQQQLDYTLCLVATGRIPKECGVQIALLDLLMDEGAAPNCGLGALANGNIDAARHLIERGEELTLAVATGLGRIDDIKNLAPAASGNEKLTALAVAAFYGYAGLVALLLTLGAEPNGYPESNGFHHHATPLHQAVSSGSLECVKLLVEAGASLNAKDKVYDGTPLDWAEHLKRTEDGDEQKKHKYKQIEAYLENIGNI